MKKSVFYLFFVLILSNVLVSNVAAEERRYDRTEEVYAVPDVILINQNREKVRLVELLASDKPVLLDFIYGTCTTICPILSASFSHLQKKLSPNPDQVQLVSISIDPEHDTPDVMAEYLTRYQAEHGWDFLTGSREDVEIVMHAFDAYVQDKMSHYPLILIRSPDGSRWVRIYGLVGTKELKQELDALYNQ